MERKELIGKEATSKETLEDLEEDQESVTDDSEDSSLPSPDGAFDDSEELEDADPV